MSATRSFGFIMRFIETDQINTRLHSNLRPTTRKCVHLVTFAHFRSRNKDGGQTIQSAKSKNFIQANFINLLCPCSDCMDELRRLINRHFIMLSFITQDVSPWISKK